MNNPSSDHPRQREFPISSFEAHWDEASNTGRVILGFPRGAPIVLATDRTEVMRLWVRLLLTPKPFYYYSPGRVGISTDWETNQHALSSRSVRQEY